MIRLLLATSLLCAAGPDAARLSDEALALAQSGRFAEAEKRWAAALEINPNFFPALFNLGLRRYAEKDYETAARLLAQAVALEPRDFNTRFLAGAALSALGRTEEALRHWRAAQKLNPYHLRLLQLMIVEYGKGRYFQEAAGIARTLLEQNPAEPDPWFIAIKAFQDAGEYQLAADAARRAVERFPNSARAHFEYGFHLQKTGASEEALSHLRRAIQLDPGYEEPPFFLADLLMRLDRPAEALPYAERAVALKQDYVAARVLLARILLKLNQPAKALALLEETVRLAPDHPQPYLLLAQIYFQQGDEQKARRARQVSSELRRKNPALLEAAQGRPFPDQ